MIRPKNSAEKTEAAPIPGYDYGAKEMPHSPVSIDELERLKQTATLTKEDEAALRRAGDILEDQTEEIINTWRNVIGKTPHLAYYFTDRTGKPDENYKERVKARFKQWVVDTCRRPYDQKWLDYQHEIGLRHTHLKKNATEHAATPPHIPFRYVMAFTAVINDTIEPFLAGKGNDPDEVERMHRAWRKAVVLHVTLWSRAYLAESDW